MITDTRIRNAKPAKSPYKLTDSGGLLVEIRPTGAKLWRYRYRIAGKENLYALGEYAQPPRHETPQEAGTRRAGGKFTLAEARGERDRCRGLVKQGIHPAQQRRLEAIRRTHEGAATFEAVAREWIEQNAAHWTPKSKAQREALLDRKIFPRIGTLPARQITPAHVLAILKGIEATSPQSAILARQTIGAVMRLAVSTLRAEADPTQPLSGAIKAPPTEHKTPLKHDEITAFFRALDSASGTVQTKAAMRLLWLTLARTGELLGARWQEFALERALWTVPAERMKKRTEHLVPLPSQAVEILRSLRAFTGQGEFVFPNRSSLGKPTSVGVLWKAVERMGFAGKFSPHAIRTTGSTMLNEQGFPGDWIERQLAHVERNKTRAAYHRAAYLEQRRKMMQQWADQLDALCNGANVTPIRKHAA